MILLYNVVKRIDGVLGGLTLQTFTSRGEAVAYIDRYPGDKSRLTIRAQAV